MAITATTTIRMMEVIPIPCWLLVCATDLSATAHHGATNWRHGDKAGIRFRRDAGLLSVFLHPHHDPTSHVLKWMQQLQCMCSEGMQASAILSAANLCCGQSGHTSPAQQTGSTV